MTYHLENQHLKIAVALKGAELKSVVKKATQQEIVWQGNPDFWAKSSPVLFPIVGTLKNERYSYEAKEYQLPRHGFARDYHFVAKEPTDSQLIFSLEATEETLKVYPFLFKLQIIYTLKDHCLEVAYTVENVSATDFLYFSLGAHPAFKVGEIATAFNNYSLHFNKDTELKANNLKDGLLTTAKQNVVLKDQKLQLDYKLFENDALVLLNMKSDKITLLNENDVSVLEFSFANFPYFGLWTIKDSGFLCLEPWAGFSDFETHNQQLENKAGINILQPKETWSAWWSVCF